MAQDSSKSDFWESRYRDHVTPWDAGKVPAALQEYLPNIRKGGRVWRVRWRDADGRARSKVIGRKADADHFDAEITRRKRLGQLALVDQGKQTLGEFVVVWWRDYAQPNLAPSRNYSSLWDAHVAPRLCHYRMRDLTPQTIDAFRAQLHSAGVGDAAIRKSMVILQGVLQRAVEWEWLSRNPVAGVRKPFGATKAPDRTSAATGR